MGELEVIDMLCGITEELSLIVKKQAVIIEQTDIAEEIKLELKQMREKTDSDLDIAEYRMRHIK